MRCLDTIDTKRPDPNDPWDMVVEALIVLLACAIVYITLRRFYGQ